MLDAILQLRSGENEELRYAARSWSANLPHRQLVVAGGRPDWLTDVVHHPGPNTATKYVNAYRHLRTLLSDDSLTDDVILVNDDHFIMEPMAEVPLLNWGSYAGFLDILDEMHPGSAYTKAAHETDELMQRMGLVDTLAFQLHVPYVVNRAAAIDVLDRIALECQHLPYPFMVRIQWLSVLNNTLGLRGTTLPADVKVYQHDRPLEWPSPFLSSCDASFSHGVVGTYLRRRFPEPSHYEAR